MTDLVAVDATHVWHPYASADGPYLRMADGRTVIDGMASWWSAIHGYNHPALNAAVTTQVEQVAHVMFGGLTHEPAARLAELLATITPEPLSRVFFCDSGSVSVEVAMKMAIQFWYAAGQPRKHRFATVRGGYHGDTFAAMSVCDPVNGMHHVFAGRSGEVAGSSAAGLLPQQLFAPRPRSRFGTAYDPSDTDELAALLERQHEDIAAVILEPVVQGAGGMWFYAPEYVTAVRRLCDSYDLLLILDEIATGFGRTGQLFAADHAGVAADIMCLGKAMTGGYLSMAATMCTDRIADRIDSGEPGILLHGPTFMGNPLAAAVARASIELLLSSPWQQRVADLERSLTSGLADARHLPGVADVRVLGAIGVIEAVNPIDAGRVQDLLLDRGVWLRPFGRLLYTMPPYILDESDAKTLSSAMVDAAALL